MNVVKGAQIREKELIDKGLPIGGSWWRRRRAVSQSLRLRACVRSHIRADVRVIVTP